MLADLQTRLERHFQSLREERSGLAYPVYALEHGLDASEVVALRETLSADLVTVGFTRKQHWLLWTVVAAEVVTFASFRGGPPAAFRRRPAHPNGMTTTAMLDVTTV